MQSSNSAVHNGIWNATSNVFTMLAGFVSSILIVRGLAPESYGTYSYFVWLASILSALGSLGFPNALNKFVSELRGQGRPATALRLIRWTGAVLLLLNLLVSAVVVMLALGSDESRIFLLIAGAVPLVNVFVAIPTATLMGFERFRPLSIATSAGGLVQLVLVILASVQGWGVIGYLVAVLSINVLLAVALTTLQIGGFRHLEDSADESAPFRPRTLRPFLAFVLPATLYHTIFNAILWQRPEVFFLERLSSLEQVGFFNLAFTIFNILLLLGWALINGFYPAISRDFGAGNWSGVRRHIDQGILLAFVFGVPFTFGLVATLEGLITIIYGHKMLPAVTIGQVLVLGLVPGVVAGVMGLTLNALRRPWQMVGLSGIIAVVKVGLVVLLVPGFGAVGAAWSTSVSAIVAVLLEYLVLTRLFTIGITWRPLAAVLAIGAVTTYAVPVLLLTWLPGPGGLALAIPLAALLYLLALWRFGFLERLDLVLTRPDPDHLRILHILGERKLLPDPESGGTSGIVRAVLAIAQNQAAAGHQVWVASVGPEAFQVRWKNITLVSLPPAPWAIVRLGRRTLDFRYYLHYIRLTLLHPFDVIHGHFNNYLRFLRARIRVAHFHGDPFYRGAPHEQLAFRATDFKVIRQSSDVQVGISHFVSRQLAIGLGAGGNVRTVYNGVDSEAFDSDRWPAARRRWRDAWGADDDSVVFLFAGAVAPEKGVHLVAEAFVRLHRRYPRIHLAVVGSGDLWRLSNTDTDPFEGYTRLVQQTLQPALSSGRVHLLGKQPAVDMPGIYSACDVLVVPSVWREGFGLVAAEALASGRPVIASNSGGLPEAVGEQNGLLFEIGDVDELTEAMDCMAGDSALRRRLGAAARASVVDLTWARTARELLELYTTTLSAKTYLTATSEKVEDAQTKRLAT